MSRRSVMRYWHLLRYHRPSQFALRAVSQVRRWLLRKTRGGQFVHPLVKLPEMRPTPQLQLVADRRLSNQRSHRALARAEAVRAGRFCFLNRELCLPDPVDWRLSDHPDVDALWRFHLHYHEFLLDLLVEKTDRTSTAPLDRAWQLVRQWIVANPLTDPRTHGDAWHPFCISRRLPVWIVLWQIAPPPGELMPAVVESMFRQATFLAAHLERDLGGNHVLENAHALALAGGLFDGAAADDWLRIARETLQRELPEQILPHGEHFERSPMYHLQMLDAMLDIRDAVRELDPDLSRQCGNTASRMADFLKDILHPDGEIPLLGDSAFGEAPPVGELIRQAAGSQNHTDRPVAETALGRRTGDYWSWRDDGDFLLLDGGPVGPDHLPAHAHSDLSTFEISIGGRRLVVDSGVFAYRDDELRQYCRSTAAHNVLQIDDSEQCDTWSRFRMGYRGRPVAFESGRAGNFDWARIRHNAFRRIGVPEVGRWVACRRGGPWLVVDWAEGNGSHLLTNRIHLHPDVEVDDHSSTMVRLRLGCETIRLGTLGRGTLEIQDGFYYPEFGLRMNSSVVCWSTRADFPAACGWWLDRGESPGTACLDESPFEGAALHWRGAVAQIAWHANDVFGNRLQIGRSGFEQCGQMRQSSSMDTRSST